MTRAIEDPVADASLRARARVERALVRLQTGEAGEAPGAVADEALDVLSRGRDETGPLPRVVPARRPGVDRGARGCGGRRLGARGRARRTEPATTSTLLAIPAGAPRPRCSARRLCQRRSCAAAASAMQVAYSPLARGADAPSARGPARHGRRPRGGPPAPARRRRGAARGWRPPRVGDRAGGRNRGAAVRVSRTRPRRGCVAAFEQLEAMGEKALLADTAAMLARVLYDAGRLDEADEVCAVAESRPPPVRTCPLRSGGAASGARLLAARGRVGEAEALARAAVRLAADTDFLWRVRRRSRGWGPCCARAGRDDEAAAVVAAAVAVYVRKGDVVSAARWREDERRRSPHVLKDSRQCSLIGDGQRPATGPLDRGRGLRAQAAELHAVAADVMVEGQGDAVDGGTWKGKTDGRLAEDGGVRVRGRRCGARTRRVADGGADVHLVRAGRGHRGP